MTTNLGIRNQSKQYQNGKPEKELYNKLDQIEWSVTDLIIPDNPHALAKWTLIVEIQPSNTKFGIIFLDHVPKIEPRRKNEKKKLYTITYSNLHFHYLFKSLNY